MSIQVETPWDCPACKKRNITTRWQTVNVSVNPEIAAKVADGSLFSVTCEHCESQGRFNYSMQYHDQERKRYCFYHSPQEPVTRDTKKALQFAEREFGRSYQLRRVYDLDSLIELASIWRDGLDDVAMLCHRLMLAAEIMGMKGSYPPILRYMGRGLEPGQDPEDEMFDYIAVLKESEPPLTVHAPAYKYLRLVDMVLDGRTRFFPAGKCGEWTDQTALQIVKRFR